jgi:acetoin utilization deacetylase AcuC-like enzyme
MQPTGITRHPIYLQHDMGPWHPESPKRLEAIYNMLDEPDMASRFALIEPRPATREEIEEIHTQRYFDIVEASRGRRIQLDPDTSTSEQSFDAALMAAGGTIEAIDAIMRGDIRNAFCLHRPPGHHAEAGRSSGFCLFNNIAIGAAHALKRSDCNRIMIIDPDLHHGNGTQHSFYDRKNVLYVSMHQYPYFPGTGAFNEIGSGEGKGYSLNIPLSADYGDGDYVKLFDEIIIPVGREFNPDLILISAGVDISAGDPLGLMQVTHRGFGAIFERMLALADEVCKGRLAAMLEGGYDLDNLIMAIGEALRIMSAKPSEREHLHFNPLKESATTQIINQVRMIHGRHWTALA